MIRFAQVVEYDSEHGYLELMYKFTVETDRFCTCFYKGKPQAGSIITGEEWIDYGTRDVVIYEEL
jgi:hypothetical protein